MKIIDLLYQLKEWWERYDNKLPSFDCRVHVNGKNPRKGLARVLGRGNGPDITKKYFIVQYDGEDPFTTTRDQFFLIKL